jgi:hypothetical protein
VTPTPIVIKKGAATARFTDDLTNKFINKHGIKAPTATQNR